jgi:hypothetical protein
MIFLKGLMKNFARGPFGDLKPLNPFGHHSWKWNMAVANISGTLR